MDPIDSEDDLDQENPVDMTSDAWLEFYSTHEARTGETYDFDHDHSMDY